MPLNDFQAFTAAAEIAKAAVANPGAHRILQGASSASADSSAAHGAADAAYLSALIKSIAATLMQPTGK